MDKEGGLRAYGLKNVKITLIIIRIMSPTLDHSKAEETIRFKMKLNHANKTKVISLLRVCQNVSATSLLMDSLRWVCLLIADFKVLIYRCFFFLSWCRIKMPRIQSLILSQWKSFLRTWIQTYQRVSYSPYEIKLKKCFFLIEFTDSRIIFLKDLNSFKQSRHRTLRDDDQNWACL